MPEKDFRSSTIQSQFLKTCDVSVTDFKIEPFTMVIFGGAGDLSQRLLLPSLFHLFGEEKLIKEFKSGKTRVIFLNSRNNGAGINLQECTDIILYHQMETSTTTQILGRANRIGRTDELNVHHLQIC